MPSIRPGRRTARTLFLTFLGFAVLGLIGASPWALEAFDGSRSRWERLSFIGQTYGAASALLAVLALIGIVATLVLQAHDTRIAREEARHNAITDLLKMAMDDPDLDEAWGPVPAGESRKARRQLMYINMIVSEWQMSFVSGALNETRLRGIAREMFEGRPGRAYWREARGPRLSAFQNRRARRFNRILDDEYQHTPEPPPERPRRRWGRAIAITASAAAVTLAPLALRILRRRP